MDVFVSFTDNRVFVPVNSTDSRLFSVPDCHKNKSDKPAKSNVPGHHCVQPKQNHEIFTTGHQI